MIHVEDSEIENGLECGLESLEDRVTPKNSEEVEPPRRDGNIM